MRKWDEALLQFRASPYFYKRFIDDGFGIWTEGEKELKLFAEEHANSIHPSIQIELRYDKKKIRVSRHSRQTREWTCIYERTDLYVKPSDKQLYPKSSSNNPPNTKKGLAYGLGLRIRRICEKESDYLQHRQELKLQLRRRGYSGKLIETQLRKVDKLDRDKLLKMKRQDKNAKRVPLVVIFSNLLPDMHSVVRKHMDVLYRSGKMREVFKEPPIVALRRDRNLCDSLVHSKTNKAVNSSSQTCRDGCKKCQRIVRDQVSNTSGDSSYTPGRDGTCRTRNVNYGIICLRCASTVYVGETE